MTKSLAWKGQVYYTKHIRRSVLRWHKREGLVSERRGYEDIGDQWLQFHIWQDSQRKKDPDGG